MLQHVTITSRKGDVTAEAAIKHAEALPKKVCFDSGHC